MKYKMQRQGTFDQKQEISGSSKKQANSTDAEHVMYKASGLNERFACMKFDVIITNLDDGIQAKNLVICKELFMSQNQSTLTTELRLSDDTRLFGLEKAVV